MLPVYRVGRHGNSRARQQWRGPEDPPPRTPRTPSIVLRRPGSRDGYRRRPPRAPVQAPARSEAPARRARQRPSTVWSPIGAQYTNLRQRRTRPQTARASTNRDSVDGEPGARSASRGARVSRAVAPTATIQVDAFHSSRSRLSAQRRAFQPRRPHDCTGRRRLQTLVRPRQRDAQYPGRRF